MSTGMPDFARRLLHQGACVVQAGAVAAAVHAGSARLGPAQAGVADINVTEEIECLALTIYFEARGEPEEGKLAVGHVVMNRTLHPLFPEDVCTVVRQGSGKRYRCQFTWWCDGRSDRPRDPGAWERSKLIARQVFWKAAADPTGGALWYHADYVRPPWYDKLDPGPKIGRHIFYRLNDGTTALRSLDAN